MNYFDGLKEVGAELDGEKVLTEEAVERLKQLLRDYGVEVR